VNAAALLQSTQCMCNPKTISSTENCYRALSTRNAL
jgi:hypothetical protein